MTANSTSVDSDTLTLSRRELFLARLRSSRSIWLPVLAGFVLAAGSAYLLIHHNWAGLIGVALIPALAALAAYPFLSVLAWLALAPFFVNAFDLSSRYLFWTLHRALIPAALAIALLRLFTGRRNARPLRVGWVDLAGLAFIVLAVLNILLLAEEPLVQLVRYYDRFFIPLMIFWLMRLLAPGERELRWLLWAAVFIILSQGAIGLLSWFAPGMLPPAWLNRVGQRTVGSFANPAVYTSTLLFCILLLFAAAEKGRTILGRMGALFLVIAGFFLVFFSFSRGSWLGGLAVCIGLLFVYPRTLIKMMLAGGLISIVLLSLPAFSGFVTFAEERLLNETTAESRLISNNATLRMIEAKPLQGWGFGNHEKYDDTFRTSVFGLSARGAQSSHNTYLLMAAELGIPALLIYFMPVAILLALSVQRYRRLPAAGWMGRSMLFMLWLLLLDHFILANFTDLVQSNFYSTAIWWLALGWIANILDSTRVSRPVIWRGRERVYEQ